MAFSRVILSLWKVYDIFYILGKEDVCWIVLNRVAANFASF